MIRTLAIVVTAAVAYIVAAVVADARKRQALGPGIRWD